MPALRRHGETIASFGSRQTGQPGCTLTAEYIRDQFCRRPRRRHAQHGPCHRALSQARHPSASQTAAQSRRGPWSPTASSRARRPPAASRAGSVQAGEAAPFEDVDGKDLDGAILLLDYNSGSNWLELMELGAARRRLRRAGLHYVAPDRRQVHRPRAAQLPSRLGRKADAARSSPRPPPVRRPRSSREMALDNVDAP